MSARPCAPLEASAPGPFPAGGWGILIGGLAAWSFIVLMWHLKSLGEVSGLFKALVASYDLSRYPETFSFFRMAAAWINHIWHLAQAVAVSVGALGLGLVALNVARLEYPGRGLKELLALAVGFAFLGLLHLGGGLAGLWYAGWSAGWIVAGWVLFWPRRAALMNLAPPPANGLGVRFFKVVAVSAGIVITAVALAPEVFYDSLVYHVADPFHWAKVHKIVFLPYNFFSNFPFAFEMLFGIGAMFGHDSVGRLLHSAISFTAAGLAGWMAWWLAGNAGASDGVRTGAGWVAAAIYLTTPLIANSAWMTGIDSGLVLYETAAVLGVMLWWFSRKEGRAGAISHWLVVAAALAGLGMGAKYTVGLTVGLLGVGIAVRTAAPDGKEALRAWLAVMVVALIPATAGNVKEVWEFSLRESMGPPALALYGVGALAGLVWLVRRWGTAASWRGVRLAVIFGLITWLFVSPWNVKSWLFTHNPFYPFAFKTFASLHVSEWRMGYQMGEFREYGRRPILQWLTHPWQLTRISDFSNNSACGPLFLGLLPLLLVFRRLDAGLKLLGLVVLGRYLLWSNLSNIVRYFVPGLALLGILIAVFVEVLCAHRPLARLVGRVSVGVFSLVNVATLLIIAQGSVSFMGVLLGLEKERSFLLRQRPSYPCPQYRACEEINRNLPANAGVLLVGDARAAFVNRRALAATVFDFPPLTDLCVASFTSSDINRKLRQLGMTHVLLNVCEGSRTNGYHVFDWPTPRCRDLFEKWWTEHLALEWRAGQLELFSIAAEGVGERTAALKLVQTGYTEYPELSRIHQQAGSAIKAGRLSEAEKLARELVSRAPRVAGIYEMLGYACAMQGKNREAIRAYSDAIDLGMQTSQIYHNLAALNRQLGRRRASVKAYQKASEVELRWPEPK